ncbi:MAG: hypothetical protein ACYC9O_17845 [Candidatus Latescibacterota bacterium]
MDLTLFTRLSGWAGDVAVFGLNLLIHTTIIILAGLTVTTILRMRRKGAAARSLLLRVCLGAVLASPTVLATVLALDLERTYTILPLPDAEKENGWFANRPYQLTPIPESGEIKKDIKDQNDMKAGRTRGPEMSAGAGIHDSVSREYSDSATRIPGDDRLGKKVATAFDNRGIRSAEGSASPGEKNRESGRVTTRPSLPIHRIIPVLPLIFVATWILLSLFLLVRAAVILVYIRRLRSVFPPPPPRKLPSRRPGNERFRSPGSPESPCGQHVPGGIPASGDSPPARGERSRDGFPRGVPARTGPPGPSRPPLAPD